jgi:hypothetical protein
MEIIGDIVRISIEKEWPKKHFLVDFCSKFGIIQTAIEMADI